MKATFNNIVENLVKVLTDKAESAQYYSDNEQYTGICGWCGVMSPASRPAYIKTFGKDTTEAAEAKAREIIAEKEAARQRTKYAEHAREADNLEGVPAVGGFFWADNSGLKCDGGRGLFEELHALTYYTHAAEKPARLCCVEQIINVSEEDFARPDLADELVTRHNLQGFCRSEDVTEDRNIYNYIPEEWATFYTVGTLVVSPSGKYYLIDSEGYDYARYIYVPIEWSEMFADEVASVKAKEEARKAEEERQAAEEKAQRLAEYRKRCAKWLPLMRNVEKMEQDGTATARKIDNARKGNIMAMCAAAFPGVKFSVSVRRGWGADFELTWTDGPTVEEFNAKTDLDLFCRCRDTFNGWDDSTDVEFAEFYEFADLTMGSNCGDIDAAREMSDEARAELLAKIFAAVPAADNRDKYGYTEAYTYTNKEAETVAAALGVDVFDIFVHGYAENAETIARRAWNVRSYTKTTTPEPTDPKPGKAQAANSTDTAEDFSAVLASDRLKLLRSAAADFDRLTQAGERIAAVNARLSALFACGVDVSDLVQCVDYKADLRARQRAAVVLTPDEFRTLYGFSKQEQPEDCGKVWQFERYTDYNGHELHEIRRVPSGFMVFVNVSDENGGGCAFPQKFATYQAAFETLEHFRPGAKLTERINGAGDIDIY